MAEETKTKPKDDGIPKGVPVGYEKLDDDFGEKWVPEKIGEQLRGKYIRLAYVPQQGRAPFATHVIRDEDGNTWSVASAILQRRMERIPEGTDVCLVYQGQVKMKTSAGSSRAFDVYYPKNTQLKAQKPPDLDEYDRA